VPNVASATPLASFFWCIRKRMLLNFGVLRGSAVQVPER
jgi:hypothetical protein